ELFEEASRYKVAGNHAFGKGDYTEALKYYQLALTTCPSILSTSTTSVSDDDQGYNDNDNGEESKEELSIHSSTTTDTKINVVAAAKYRTERAVYHANMAACHIKLKEYQLAIEGCSAALELDPSYTRALQRKAQAEELLGTFASMNQAKEDHLKVASKKKHRMLLQSSEQALKRMEPILKEMLEKEKAEMMAKLKSMGNTLLGKFGLSTDNFQMKQDPATGGYSFNFVNNP
ncbi:MAG: hypothetical protein JOS17DRAFT_680590, partial [Linnemannia elongata]